ncbi:MAG TPA: alpha/beta hydrolase [Candidatus Dormibacteraeota bacterium]|nr:alpha/beta hydrolase [Candidatus Dormibacteraeota bacterium]
MPLDPQARAFIDQIAALGIGSLSSMGVAEARQSLELLSQMRGAEVPLASAVDRPIPGPAGAMPVRVYTPNGTAPFPLLVYFHGGGWVLGSLGTHDGICRSLAAGAGCVVVSVDYRLAPEHRYPAAADDCYAATQWCAAHAAELGADAARIAIGGDSAGGNLTAVVAQMARDRGGPRLVFQLLIYPVTDVARDTASYRDNADGYLLTADDMAWFWNHYLGDAPARGAEPYASPAHATSLAGLPPALVITAEFDPLRDEGEAYGAALERAGVAAKVTRYDGLIHGFFGMGAMIDKANTAVREAAGTLRIAFQRR